MSARTRRGGQLVLAIGAVAAAVVAWRQHQWPRLLRLGNWRCRPRSACSAGGDDQHGEVGEVETQGPAAGTLARLGTAVNVGIGKPGGKCL